MVKRREHNYFVRIYDPEFAARPGAYDGYPCSRCDLPILRRGIRDAADRLVHENCAEPPSVEDVAIFLMLHDARAAGRDLEEVWDEIPDHELDRRVTAYREGWISAQRARETAKPTRRSTAMTRGNSAARRAGLSADAVLQGELAGEFRAVCELLARALAESTDSSRTQVRATTTRPVADAVMRLVGHRANLLARPRGTVTPGLFVISVAAEDRVLVSHLLRSVTR